MFVANVQHNCIESRCSDTGTRRIFQERRETSITERTIKHTDDGVYILNMHALHNASLIRKVLPRSLTAPKPYVEDRHKLHTEAAAQLRGILHTRREATKATRALKTALASSANPAPEPCTAPTGTRDSDTILSTQSAPTLHDDHDETSTRPPFDSSHSTDDAPPINALSGEPRAKRRRQEPGSGLETEILE